MKPGSTILMLEDDPDDRFMTEETLKELGYRLPIKFLSYSHELFNELKKIPKPVLILIDYHSGPDNAVKILKQLKSHADYKAIPVIVLSETSPPFFISECYALGASSFIIKPSTNEMTREKIDGFFKYWMKVAEL